MAVIELGSLSQDIGDQLVGKLQLAENGGFCLHRQRGGWLWWVAAVFDQSWPPRSWFLRSRSWSRARWRPRSCSAGETVGAGGGLAGGGGGGGVGRAACRGRGW